MFQNAAIDIAIALALMYLLLSLTCTVINEYIASKLNLRSRSLALGLQALLDDQTVRKAFYEHGLIAGTRGALTTAGSISVVRSLQMDPPAVAAPRPGAGGAPLGAAAAAAPATPAGAAPSGIVHPSYFSTNTFVLALLGSLTGGKTAGGQAIPTFADVESAIETLPPSNLRDALVTNLIVAQGDFEKFRTGVATWFDDSMDRLSGAYKRNLKVISIAVGCLMALVLNADTFAVSQVLWSDSALRAQMVQVAESTVNAGFPSESTGEQTPKMLTADEIEKTLVRVNGTLRPLPIGWSLRASASLSELEHNIESKPLSYWPLKLLGLFATGLALSFGAPFWFDALSTFMNLRAAGVKPERQT
jgi:hypothetical protein